MSRKSCQTLHARLQNTLLKDTNIVAATAIFLDADDQGIADKLPKEALVKPDLTVITGLLFSTRSVKSSGKVSLFNPITFTPGQCPTNIGHVRWAS